MPLLKAENGGVTISGSGIFNKDRLIAKITTDDTRSLVLLRGEMLKMIQDQVATDLTI